MPGHSGDRLRDTEGTKSPRPSGVVMDLMRQVKERLSNDLSEPTYTHSYLFLFRDRIDILMNFKSLLFHDSSPHLFFCHLYVDKY